MPPRRAKVTVDLSDDGESAAHQLLTESQLHTSLLAMDFAERSASLLNAARAAKRTDIPSSPPNGTGPEGKVGGKLSSGKLKRPKFQKVNSTKLPLPGTTRRKDVYDLSASPEKSRVPLEVPVTANQKPAKVVRGRKTSKAGSRRHEPSSAAPTSPPPQLPEQTVEGDSHRDKSAPRKSGRLAGKDVDISNVNWEKRPESHANHARIKRKATLLQVEHAPPIKSPRRDQTAEALAEEQQTQSNLSRTSSCSTKLHPQVVIQVRTPPLKDARAASPNEGPRQHADGNSEVSLAVAHDHQDHITERVEEEPQTGPVHSLSSSDVPPPTLPSNDAHADEADGTVHERRPKHNSEQDDEECMHDDKGEGDEEDFDENDDNDDAAGGREANPGLEGIDIVFRFIDSSVRQGTCQTRQAAKIVRTCTRACAFIPEPERTLDEVAEVCEAIQRRLQVVHLQKIMEDQKAFKEDAFAYLFHPLARVLEAVHDWLREQFGDPLRSLPSLRTLVPLMEDILSFEDSIMGWKVKLTQRSKGGGVIKDAESNFIAPLRRVHKQYRGELDRIERAEEGRRAREASLMRRRQQEEQERVSAETAHRLEQRERRWKDLHLRRLQCETSLDQRRRLHLAHRPLEVVEERDANGIPFEREPIFCDRVTPLPHRLTQSDERVWTDEQIEALREGLENYSGPRVYEKIFKKYCTLGRDRKWGPLRDFNVAEITGQAAVLRSGAIDYHHSRNEPTPAWVLDIPILP